MITALKKIYAFSGRWKGVLKKSVVFSLLHSIFDMFQIGALFLILNGLVEGIKGQDILFAFLLLLAGVIGKIVCSYISDFSQTRVGYFMCADKRIHIGDRMKYMPMGYFNSHSLGNLTSTVTTTISDVENNAPSVLITVIHGFIHVTVITIVMFFFDWRIGLLACLGIALFLLCNSVLQKKSQEVSPKRQAAQEDLVGATLEYIQGMGIVKSFNLGGKSNQKMKQAIEESRARNTKLETVFGPYGMVQLFVLRLASVAIMFCSILFYLQGSMTLVYCLLMCVASFLIFSELEAAGGKSFALRLIESSIDKVNAIDDTPVMDLSGKDIAPKDTTIELQNVGFSYGDHRILNQVNLTIPAKTTTAIVGPSGSGKTTLCNLITRFWDVDEGCIKLGGTDIREYKLDSLLSNISMVFQNVFLFADSIENNIKFGKPDATHEEVVRAAKSACCHDFIMALPNGYDTVIGESGATLSGGEKQRISIARAILKDTPIIILDEATSSVDPENEAELQQAIEKLTEDKTVIIIAHRLKTVRNAQQIVVIANGGIAQRGTHQELMTQPGIYADFVNIREKAVNWKISSSKIQQKKETMRFSLLIRMAWEKEMNNKQHTTTAGEDYLESVLILQKKLGMVRSVDVARYMEVSKPSVCYAVGTLREGGFLTTDENHYIHLTDLGRDVAEKIYERHCFFTHQLISVGVNPQIAEVDACRMEHAVSDESFQKLKEHAMREIASQKIDNTFDDFPVKK